MAFIQWTEANRVGVAVVDEQHRRLFDILNRLHDAVTGGKEQGEMFAVMDELMEYTICHFQTEESLQQEHGYPGAAEHKAVHDDLAAQVVEMQSRLREGSATASFELLDFLHGWLMDHTMGMDREVGPFLNERGVS